MFYLLWRASAADHLIDQLTGLPQSLGAPFVRFRKQQRVQAPYWLL
ncbi:hypothetical protein BRCON_0800 [Candidatus Sumerlaea chitinivorans]|uniref:Uncharacterized protein n=1 Tax=Sumerlaea chitinivorans TaxID=2250252 RepID=A0A2Z4Y2X8_SUMC1|nr:hypothetical protein BRCON_0800 [Candidatus Sumerlaea chitinivorans]